MEDLIENICDKMHCAQLVQDLENFDTMRESFVRAQQTALFKRVLGPTKCENKKKPAKDCKVGSKREYTDVSEKLSDLELMPDIFEEEQEPVEKSEDASGKEVTQSSSGLWDEVWHGCFVGFDVISEDMQATNNALKQCAELNYDDSPEVLEAYLRSGVRCFLLNLGVGTDMMNQELVLRLRETELKLTKEIGFPLSSTIFIRLSPRLQYTGRFSPSLGFIIVDKGDEIILSTNRKYSHCCTPQCVYVNARFLIDDVHLCDIILVGPDVQLHVREKINEYLVCQVLEGGFLDSHMPVLFPSRCDRFRISLEELEDITFAREVGINTIVSYIPGSQVYVDDLKECLQLLNCEKMRLFARVVLEDLKGCEDTNWICDSYDGFLVEVRDRYERRREVEILHLCPAAENFMKRAYELMKSIILDPGIIRDRRLIVAPQNYIEIFYYPDKYLKYQTIGSKKTFYFEYMQDAIMQKLLAEQLSDHPYCDNSMTGSNTLARAVASTAYETNSKVIMVCSITGRMAIKISHFRPHVPILLITSMRSAERFSSLYHNVLMLYYNTNTVERHKKRTYKHLLFGLLYARSMKLIKHQEMVTLVYGERAGTKMPDTYVAFKYDENNFMIHLNKALFPTCDAKAILNLGS